jgi:hypothetical protein
MEIEVEKGNREAKYCLIRKGMSFLLGQLGEVGRGQVSGGAQSSELSGVGGGST